MGDKVGASTPLRPFGRKTGLDSVADEAAMVKGTGEPISAQSIAGGVASSFRSVTRDSAETILVTGSKG
jgi:hypothetical protein